MYALAHDDEQQPAGASSAKPPPSVRRRVPDAKSTAPTITASVIAVPRSGSSRMTSRNTPSSSPIGRQSSCSDAGGLRFARCAASQTASASFASSDGWNGQRAEADPAARAVDRVRRRRARPRTRSARTATSVGASGRRRVYFQRDSDEQPGDAEHAIRPLTLEVRHRVRAADDGRRRRGAVDHHDSERRQRKRDERQDVPLRLSPHLLGEVRHQPPELLAALLEVRVLVVARARRREQDDVAGPRLAPPRARPRARSSRRARSCARPRRAPSASSSDASPTR